VIIASSSSGSHERNPEGRASHPTLRHRHPFNPPHLIPLVEIVGGKDLGSDNPTRSRIYTSIGQRTVRLNKEMPAMSPPSAGGAEPRGLLLVAEAS